MRRIVFQRYVLGLSLLVGGGLVVVAAFNALVNPFNLYTGVRITGFNEYKSELAKNSRLSKAAELRRQQPDCLILGSSRAQTGLDPAQPAWAQCRAFNLAHAGGTLYESMRYFQQAVAIQRPREVVLALDLFMFNVYRKTLPGFSEERLMVNADDTPNPDWLRSYLHDVFTNLLSWHALKASWKTAIQSRQRPGRGPEDGFWEYSRIDLSAPSRRGQREAFRRNEQAFLTTHWFPSPRRRFATHDPESGADIYNSMRTILKIAHRSGARLHLLVSPAHARQWEALQQAGLWQEFEDWKRMLVRLNDEEARIAGRSPFSLWDFSGFNAYTTESVPAEDDREHPMRWYWESSHFRKELGDLVLKIVLGRQDAVRETVADFGVRLDAANLDVQLAAIRAARSRWQQSHEQDVTEIAAIVSRTASWRLP